MSLDPKIANQVEEVSTTPEFDPAATRPASTSGSGVSGGNALDRAHSRVVRNIWFNFVGYGVTLVVSFFISPIMVHRLGDVAYGVWALVQQLVGYTILLDFGIRIAVTRYLAQHHARDEVDRINQTLSSACVVAMVPTVVIVVGGALAGFYFPRMFVIPPSLYFSARLAVFLVALSMALAGPGSLFTACVAAVSRYDLLSIRNIIFVLLRGILIWVFLGLGYGLLSVAIINLLASALGFALDIFFARSQIAGLHVHLRAFRWNTVRDLLRFSVYAFLVTIAVRLVYWSDNLVIGAFLGTAAVTYYAIGGTLVQYLRDAMDNLTRVYGPLAAQMDALGRKESLQKLLVIGTRIGSFVGIPGMIAFIFAGPAFLSLWMGPTYAARSGIVLIVLSGTILVLPLAATYSHVLYAVNRHKVNGFVAVTEAVANLGLSIFLVRRMGIVGVAWGTLVPATLIEGLGMPMYAAHVVGMSPWKYYDKAILRPLLAAPPSIAIIWLGRSEGWLRSWAPLGATVFVAMLLYVIVSWTLVLEREEKAFVMKSIRNTGLLSWAGVAPEGTGAGQ